MPDSEKRVDRAALVEAIFLAHHPGFTRSWTDTFMGQPNRRCGRCESAADAVLAALTVCASGGGD